jgi:hypothetical protein
LIVSISSQVPSYGWARSSSRSIKRTKGLLDEVLGGLDRLEDGPSEHREPVVDVYVSLDNLLDPGNYPGGGRVHTVVLESWLHRVEGSLPLRSSMAIITSSGAFVTPWPYVARSTSRPSDVRAGTLQALADRRLDAGIREHDPPIGDVRADDLRIASAVRKHEGVGEGLSSSGSSP